MGAGWRRFSEKTRQAWGLGEADFQPTPNTRNDMMLREAGDFAVQLKRCEKEIRTLKNATEGLLTTSKSVLCAPLPRVYEETGGGKVVPVPTGAASAAAGAPGVQTPIGGADFSADALAALAKETGKKLESEVLAPMERWTNAYALVHGRMSKLEALRLEVDSRRRTVARLGRRVDAQRARLPQTRARGEYEMEATIKVLQHKESKLSACRQSFKEHEALVYHQLTNLVRDTVWLKSYLSAVLRLEAEAFAAAAGALGSARAGAAAPAGAGAALAAAADGTPAASSSLPGSPQHGIPAARGGDAAASVRLAGAAARKAGSGAGSLGGAKDSLYTTGDRGLGAAHGASAGYDRYAEAPYARSGGAPPPAW